MALNPLSLLMTGNGVARSISALVGCALPALMSYKALTETSSQEKKQQLSREALQYWTVFGALLAAEGVLDPVVRRVPLYYQLKVGLVCMLLANGSEGAAEVVRLIKPVLKKNSEELDMVTSAAVGMISTAASQIKLVVKWGRKLAGMA